MSDGMLGDAPDWYILLKVAKYLGVPPWDLARQPVAWLRMGVLALGSENRRAERGA